MHTLDETSCAKGKPLRSLWTADEARMVKRILNNLTVKQWNLPSTEVERDLSGDWTIWIPEGGGGAGTSAYRSYFRVVDSSTSDPEECRIGVTDGGYSGTPTNCGTVKINNEAVDVPVYSQEVSSAGQYYVWLHLWIDAEDGESAEIRIGAVDVDTRPGNVNSGVAYASHLLGRVVVGLSEDRPVITSIIQDYLRGGEYETWLWGDCTGLELEE